MSLNGDPCICLKAPAIGFDIPCVVHTDAIVLHPKCDVHLKSFVLCPLCDDVPIIGRFVFLLRPCVNMSTNETLNFTYRA